MALPDNVFHRKLNSANDIVSYITLVHHITPFIVVLLITCVIIIGYMYCHFLFIFFITSPLLDTTSCTSELSHRMTLALVNVMPKF